MFETKKLHTHITLYFDLDWMKFWQCIKIISVSYHVTNRSPYVWSVSHATSREPLVTDCAISSGPLPGVSGLHTETRSGASVGADVTTRQRRPRVTNDIGADLGLRLRHTGNNNNWECLAAEGRQPTSTLALVLAFKSISSLRQTFIANTILHFVHISNQIINEQKVRLSLE